MLEPDSELYNTGIVDVSHRYPKMYVVRPQFFISIITVLRNAAMNSLKYKAQDVTLKKLTQGNPTMADKFAELKSVDLTVKE